MATLTITDVTKTNFEARIQVLKSVNDKVDLKVHYIAIGAGHKTT